MGSFFSRFFRDAPIEKVLEEIDKQLLSTQERQVTVRQIWRSRMSVLFVATCLCELVYFLFYYFYLTVAEESELSPLWIKAFYSSLLLLGPLIALMLGRLLNLYYGRKLTSIEFQLEELKIKQKNKLEEFARATDFYKTQALIHRYSKTLQPNASSPQKKDNHNNSNNSGSVVRRSSAPALPRTSASLSQGTSLPVQSSTPSQSSVPIEAQPRVQTAPAPYNPAPVQSPPTRYVMPVPRDRMNLQSEAPATPIVVDSNMAWYDRMMDYLVGPEYALPPQSQPVESGKPSESSSSIGPATKVAKEPPPLTESRPSTVEQETSKKKDD